MNCPCRPGPAGAMRSNLIGQHHGYSGLGIVDVQRPAHGDQLDQPGAALVVADVEGEREAGGAPSALPILAN